MTTQQIQLVQDSWKSVLPIAEQAGALFYRRLFEIAPHFRPMFSSDISFQSRKLMGTLAVVVSRLHQLDSIIDQVQKLGAKHNDYGVRPEHYATVGEALLWTLEQGLGEGWNEALKEAWATAYGILSTAMIEAASTAKMHA